MDVSIADQIHFTYAPGTSIDQVIGFEMAGLFWSNHLADDVDINILVEMTDALPEDVIGGALPGIEANVRYDEFRQKLTQDITSDLDVSVDSNQQEQADKFAAVFRSQFDELTGYKVDNNEYLKMTRANAKALGIRDTQDSALDGYILMRDLDGSGSSGLESLSWQYNYSNNTINSDRLDFLSVAIHEVGHVLGFVSGLDQANWLSDLDRVSQWNEADYYSRLTGKLNNTTPMDMLRFSQISDQMGGNGNWIDMSIGGNPFLSFAGSSGDAVAYFATGENTSLGGDGHQASHWKNKKDSSFGIMDPTLSAGQRRKITDLDKDLFDAIGWDVEKGKDSLLGSIKQQVKEHYGYTLENIVNWLKSIPTNQLIQDFQDDNLNGYDDRNEQLQEMMANSGEVYNWGWSGHGSWGGNWGGWGGYRQTVDMLPGDSFWQNFSWQTVEIPSTSPASDSSPESSEINIQVLDIPGTTEPVFSDISSNNAQELNFDVENKDDLSNGDENESLLGEVNTVEPDEGWDGTILEPKGGWSGDWDDFGYVQPNWGWSGHWYWGGWG